jgi:RNA polymerase sigma-70 factor (ECF subfamily)
MDDEQGLIAAWRGGDSNAGNELFGRCLPSLARFFRNKVTRDADDLVQRTLELCVASHANFRGDSSFRSFVLGVANNVLYKHIRATASRPRVGEVGEVSIADLAPGASTMVGKDEQEQQVIDALRRVPLDQQVVLELHYWEELTVKEIAEALGIPLGTAATRLQAGRRALRAHLDGRLPR